MTALGAIKAPAARKTRAGLSAKGKEALVGGLLASPAIALLFLLIFAPMVLVLVFAFTDWQFGASSLNFVGFRNFVALSSDPTFLASLRNTLVYVVFVVPTTVVLGLVVAVLIESGKSFRAFYRAIHFLPVLATLAAMALAWEALLNPTIGLISHIFRIVGLPTENWLRGPDTALATLGVIGVWHQLGLAMVLFLAGLKTIPADLYDAAEIDGAYGTWDRFWTVTFPLLGPTTMFVTIIVTTRAFQLFTPVKLLTQGGPGNASEVLMHTLYVESFEYLRTGYGAGITVVFLLIVVTLTLLQARAAEKRVHYG